MRVALVITDNDENFYLSEICRYIDTYPDEMLSFFYLKKDENFIYALSLRMNFDKKPIFLPSYFRKRNRELQDEYELKIFNRIKNKIKKIEF